MVEYIFTLIIYVGLLIISSLVFILISRCLTKKVVDRSIEDYNYAVIINYIYDIYNEMIEITNNTNSSVVQILYNYFSDIKELVEIIDVSNLDTIIENIKIEHTTNSSEGRARIIPNSILNLLKMKNKLTVMIFCHQIKYYNAYDLINNEEIAIKRLVKYLPKVLKKLSNAQNKNKINYKYDQNIGNICTKAVKFDEHKSGDNAKLVYA